MSMEIPASARLCRQPTRRQFCRKVLGGTMVLACLGHSVSAEAGTSLARHFGSYRPGSTISVDHRAFGRFLAKYLRAERDGINRFNYGDVTEADHGALKSYIERLETTDVAALDRKAQFAFWANLYNAVTIQVVLEAWPVESILDIRPTWISFGPCKKERVTVPGRPLSLHNIEHDILRAAWREPRVHYALNCASVGCPNLHELPFEGTDLDIRLSAYAREYVNHPRGASFDDRGRLTVSKIYRWFREDFGGTEQGVIDHLKLHAHESLRIRLEGVSGIAAYAYDWSLNAPPSGTGG